MLWHIHVLGRRIRQAARSVARSDEKETRRADENGLAHHTCAQKTPVASGTNAQVNHFLSSLYCNEFFLYNNILDFDACTNNWEPWLVVYWPVSWVQLTLTISLSWMDRRKLCSILIRRTRTPFRHKRFYTYHFMNNLLKKFCLGGYTVVRWRQRSRLSGFDQGWHRCMGCGPQTVTSLYYEVPVCTYSM